MPAFELPPSSYMSPEARAVLQQSLDHPDPAFGTDIAAARAFYGRFNDERLVEVRRRYAVEVRRRTDCGGVTVDRVLPASGIAPSNRRRIRSMSTAAPSCGDRAVARSSRPIPSPPSAASK